MHELACVAGINSDVSRAIQGTRLCRLTVARTSIIEANSERGLFQRIG
jgi:hypothetical protein